MCLFTNKDSKKIADEDIVVFKVLRVDNYIVNSDVYHTTEKIFISPYMNYQYEIGKKYMSSLVVNDNTSYNAPEGYGNHISIGMHFVPKELHAKGLISSLKIEIAHSRMVIPNFVIGKFIIPKGTVYYEGIFKALIGGYLPSIATNCAIFKEVIIPTEEENASV